MSLWVWGVLGFVVLVQIGAYRARRRSEGRSVSNVTGQLSLLIFLGLFVWSEWARITGPWQVPAILMAAGGVLAAIAFGILALIKLALGRKQL